MAPRCVPVAVRGGDMRADQGQPALAKHGEPAQAVATEIAGADNMALPHQAVHRGYSSGRTSLRGISSWIALLQPAVGQRRFLREPRVSDGAATPGESTCQARETAMRAARIRTWIATRSQAVTQTPVRRTRACGQSPSRSENSMHVTPDSAPLPLLDRGLIAVTGLCAPAGAGIHQGRVCPMHRVLKIEWDACRRRSGRRCRDHPAFSPRDRHRSALCDHARPDCGDVPSAAQVRTWTAADRSRP